MQALAPAVAAVPGGTAAPDHDAVIDHDRQLAHRDDRVLARRMLRGDREAFDRFGRDCVPPVYRFALRLTRGDGELARELVQATLCKALARLDSYRGDALLTTWLCACCRNEAAAHYRRSGREVELDEDADPTSEGSPGPEHAAVARERAGLVHRALDDLPPDYGRALEWKYLEGLAVEEIGRRLERSPKATESLLSRARRAFRRAFEERQRGRSGGGGA